MQVYFTASVSAKNTYLKNYIEIINKLKEMGHKVNADHIIDATEESIRMLSKDERLNFHEKVIHWINSCDFLVAETSYPSTSVGYEISHALRIGKPILVLYSAGDPPSLLGHHKEDRLIVEKYSLLNLKSILEDFVSYVEGKHDLRFTFFITPRIITYLDWIAKKNKMPKSVYLRKLIEDDMNKNNF